MLLYKQQKDVIFFVTLYDAPTAPLYDAQMHLTLPVCHAC